MLLTPAAASALRTQKRRQDRQRRRIGSEWESRPEFVDLVFTGPCGQPINPHADHAEWKRLLAEAGVPDARLHDARHTAATILTALGVDTAVIQRLLGHSSLATTAIYQDLTAELLQPAMDAMHAALTAAVDDQPKRRSRRVAGRADFAGGR